MPHRGDAMFTLKVENATGAGLTLTGKEGQYQVIKIEGLNPAPAQINTTAIANLDGSLFNSSRLESKNIVITIRINGDVETNRQRLYDYFPTKERVKLYYTNENRDVYIEGYVETLECDLFNVSELAQISVLCPDPYFSSVDEMVSDISNTLALFYFPFAIDYNDPVPISEFENSRVSNVYNEGSSETGVIVDIIARSDFNSITIRRYVEGDIGEEMTLVYPFLENDEIIINTNKGHKSVYLIRDSQRTNIFTAVQRDSVFFQLRAGDNLFGYLLDGSTENEEVSIRFLWRTIYRGV